MTNGDDPGRRREFRAWVRAHHPDAGGDPGEFAAGLARWRSAAAHGRRAPGEEISAFRARGGLWRVQRWWRRRRRPPRVR